MPDTYTKEQIATAKLWLTTNDTGDSPSQKRRIGFEAIVLSALDTAERERDENERKGEDLCTWVGTLTIERDQATKLAKQLAKKVAKAEGRAKLLEAQVAELEARLQGAGWISVKERLPEALERVLVFYVNDLGKNRIDVGQYIPPKTILEEDFLDSEINAQFLSTYDKENNCYWVNEGWFEDHWQAEVNYKIHDVVTHWMPLPEPPAILGEKKE